MTATGFVGAHPEGLESLARLAHESSAQIHRVAGMVNGLVARHSQAAAVEIIRLLHAVAEAVEEAAESLEWRAAAIGSDRDLIDHGLGHHRYLDDLAYFAAYTLFDPADGCPSFREWTSPPDIAALTDMSPGRVEATFSRLVPSIATELADEYPEIIGGLDGVPAELRYRANRILIHRRIAELELELSLLDELGPPNWIDWIDPRWLIATFPRRAEARFTVDRLHRQVTEYRRWLAEERQILLFDPGGDGRVVEVFGDLEGADRVAVLVPGITNDKTTFSSAGEGGFRANAAILYEAAAAIDPDVATIAWLGYDTPDGIDAGLRNAAESGVPALRRFIEGIDPRAQSAVTVVAHSYGSLVAGLAAAEGLAVDDLVFLGSPGTGLDHSSGAQLRPNGRVWVGLADGDPIAAALSPSELPPWWVPVPFMPAWLAIDMSDGPETLWHGANPAADGFGAARFSTAGSSGHSSYFEAGSLENLVRIMQGRYGDVDLAY